MGENSGTSKDIDYERPSAARIYDYLLGGFHNFEVDRAAAQKFIEMIPDAPLFMRANRAFLRRVVNFLVSEGIDQFLDLGSGIPTVGNVHEVAQKANPSSRIVYVDNEPVAVQHSRRILQDNPNAAVIEADMRQPEMILNHQETQRLLELGKPVAVLLISVLQFVPEDEEAYRLLRVIREALAPGSYIAISHPSDEGYSAEGYSDERGEQVLTMYDKMGTPVSLRSRAQLERFFEGLEMVEPGLVRIPLWHPEDKEDLFIDEPALSAAYAGVGRLP